ncbi:CoA transferase [Microbacterium sp. NPDC008134]|uniref:CoA transferase n=1 Tax=Microbacterium sp. NPDC008134 TaxID=3364183 RepID=UPI0036EF2D52
MPSSLLARVLDDLRTAPSASVEPADSPIDVPLPSRLATGELARSSVAAITAVMGGDLPALDPERIALAYRSDRFLMIDGAAPPVWSPFSGFWPASDGWVRTHGNYPHHAAALRRGLELTEAAGSEDVADAFTRMTTSDAVRAITGSGGLAVAVSRESPAHDHALRSRPLVTMTRDRERPDLAGPPTPANTGLPLAGVRVLDLTRVIAGPVCTRTLALLGADVLRIDPPGLAEAEWQHLDTGHGKRSTILDARSPRMEELLSSAHAVVLGYRPAALRRLGLDPDSLARRHPHLVVAQLSAWGTDHPDRAGFDSLVQAESGISWIESPDGTMPGALPAQALDHSAGYLLAAAVSVAIRRRRTEGGSWRVTTSLRRIAAELLGMPRRDALPAERAIDSSRHTTGFTVGGRDIVTVGAAIPGYDFAAPRPWGRDRPRW